MPVNRCGSKRKGFKWGKSGKCYPSKKKALKQGVAILINSWKIKVRRRR
jgi:hypothetical protein